MLQYPRKSQIPSQLFSWGIIFLIIGALTPSPEISQVKGNITKSQIDGFKGKWTLTWDNTSDVPQLYKSFGDLQSLSVTFRGKKSYEIRDRLDRARISGVLDKKRVNKLEFEGSFRIRSVNDEDILIGQEFDQSNPDGISFVMGADNGRRIWALLKVKKRDFRSLLLSPVTKSMVAPQL